MAVFTRFSGGFCIRRVCVAPAALPPLWAVPGPPGHEKRTPTAADAHDLKIVVKLRAVPASKVPFPVEIAGFPDFSRPVPVYPAFLKYVVPVQFPCKNRADCQRDLTFFHPLAAERLALFCVSYFFIPGTKKNLNILDILPVYSSQPSKRPARTVQNPHLRPSLGG